MDAPRITAHSGASSISQLPETLSKLLAAPPADHDDAWADFITEYSRLLLHIAHSVSAGRDDAMDAYTHVGKLLALESRFDAKLVGLESRMDAKMQRLRTELILWMFGFWTATMVPLVGLMLALHGVFDR